jgi:hypothetical protein
LPELPPPPKIDPDEPKVRQESVGFFFSKLALFIIAIRKPADPTPAHRLTPAYPQDSANAVRSFMEKLSSAFSPQDFQAFATLVREYRQQQVTYGEFEARLVQLFGHDRRHLLKGMDSFVPAEDRNAFQRFLKRQGVAV